MARDATVDRNHIVDHVSSVATHFSWCDGEEALVLNWPFMIVHARALN